MILSYFSVQLQKVYSSAEPELFVQLSKLLLYTKHHQCNACHLRNEHVYFYFFLSCGHTTVSIVCFFVCFLLFEGFPNKYLNLIEVVS